MTDNRLQHIATARRQSLGCRRGTTLIEVSASIVIVAAMASLVAGALTARARQQRAADSRELAVAEASNLMEQFTVLPWTELTDERLAPLMLSDKFRESIPGAILDVSVVADGERPDVKRIRVRIDYPGPNGRAIRPVTLTSWVYRLEPPPVAARGAKP
ncbi:MAG TPA: type II secretion system protein [Pirellulales bacterium]|nr:type II secretion system protein [Pirellulales bacterium]